MSEPALKPALPYKRIAASLRKTTERLAHEIASPGVTPPDWSDLDWSVACATASIQGTAVLLEQRLRWAGTSQWQAFLQEQRRQSLLRHELIGDTLRRVDDALRRAGVGAIALKGSALRRLNLYAPGERPMGDIDLLVRERDVAPVAGLLREQGYVRAYATHRHIVFEPLHKPGVLIFGEHVQNPLKIEVHTAIAEPLPVTAVDITSRFALGDLQPGLNTYPSLGALLSHLLIHSAGGMRAHALRQIQLNDIAALAPRLAEADWKLVLDACHTGPSCWWVYPPLSLANRYYPGCIPQRALRDAQRACPRWLRAASDRVDLTTVSWSNLRIHALPGITWSRTPLEVMRFVRGRVLPRRAALAELRTALEHQPHMKQFPWYGKSHAYRVLRWLFSRPPRVQTMLCVSAAMEQGRALPGRR